MYGCELCSLVNPSVEQFCVAGVKLYGVYLILLICCLWSLTLFRFLMNYVNVRYDSSNFAYANFRLNLITS